MSSPLSIASVESLFGYATPSDASTEEMDDVNFDTNLIRSLNELLADAAEERRGARMAAAAAAQPVPLFSSLSGLVNVSSVGGRPAAIKQVSSHLAFAAGGQARQEGMLGMRAGSA
eukprot:365750-Chlamydomonas_euryale.AAC.14